MAVSVKDIRLRIEAILATVPEVGLVITDEECAIDDADLLAVLVGSRAGTRQRRNDDMRLVTRTFELGVLLAPLCEGTIEEQREAMLDAEAMLDIIPDFFALNAKRLDLSNAPLTGVWGTGEMSDNGLETRPWGPETDFRTYYAATYQYPVTTFR